MTITDFDCAPTSASDPASISLYVLEKMRARNCGVRAEFEAFVAGCVAYALNLAGSDFSDSDIVRAVEPYRLRSPHLFYSGPHAAYIAQRVVKPAPHTPKTRRPIQFRRKGGDD